MIFNEDDGKDDEYFKRIKEQKEDEMEERRRLLVNKSEIKQRLRERHIKRQEASEMEETQQAKEAAKLKIQQLELTERLAKELSCRKYIEHQEASKARKKKYTSSNSALENIHDELIKERKQDEKTHTPSFSGWWFSEDSTVEQQVKKINYRRELQNQLINNRRKLREEAEEKQRERKIMEEVGETLHEEDVRAEKRKREVAALLQAEKEAFLKTRQFWKEKRREVLKQEHDEISRIIAKKEAQRKREAEEKSDTRAAKEAMVEKLSKYLMEEERKRIEREEICRELYLAEKEDELMKKTMQLTIEKKRIAGELLQDMAKHQKAAAEKKAKELEIDAAFVKYLAEERRNLEERKRQETQARRERSIQYRNELKEAMARNREQRAKDSIKIDATENLFTWGNGDEDRKLKCYSESALDALKSQENKNATST
nr:PREDICTED: meiosis-specific nuclear structural protein 1-like [Megachile rotundata]